MEVAQKMAIDIEEIDKQHPELDDMKADDLSAEQKKALVDISTRMSALLGKEVNLNF